MKRMKFDDNTGDLREWRPEEWKHHVEMENLLNDKNYHD